jgi:hypothetical protein
MRSTTAPLGARRDVTRHGRWLPWYAADTQHADTRLDCEARKGEWYDQDEPDTAIPARTLWGEPVVAPNGKTYRRSKGNIALPPEWLHAFCDTDWTAERKSTGAAMFKATPR